MGLKKVFFSYSRIDGAQLQRPLKKIWKLKMMKTKKSPGINFI